MRRYAALLALAAVLAGAGCGEITGFCMTAGAPTGLKIVVTKTPQGIKCSYQTLPDTVPRPTPQTPPR